MHAAKHNPKPAPQTGDSRRNADPMKRAACVVLIVRFTDGNARPFYSRDIDYNDYRRNNAGYWTTRFQKMIEEESPAGWKGKVDQAAIFRCFDGNRGDKICQYDKVNGWQLSNSLI